MLTFQHMLTFLIQIGGCLIVLATLPSLFELLLVTTGAFRKTNKRAAEGQPKFSLAVVIPAHNEEQLVGRCVTSLLTSVGNLPNVSIFVVADNCTDSTAERARSAGAQVLVRTNPSERGKGFALRFAFDYLMPLGFDGLAVVDADSLVSENFIREIVSTLASGADAAQTRYRVARPLNTRRKRLMDVALLAFNVLRPKGRHGYGLSAGVLGNGFALSAQTLLKVPYLADSIVEDLEYHLLLVQAGKRVEFIDAATVFGDIPEDSAAQETQRARWEGGRMRLAVTKAGSLFGQLCRGQYMVVEPLLELLTWPLAHLVVLMAALFAIPNLGCRIYAVMALSLIATHVVSGLTLSGDMKEGLTALLSAPAYVFWKLTKSAAIIRFSKSDTPWLRTKRSADAKAS